MWKIPEFQILLVVCATAAFVASLQLLRRYLELRHERLVSARGAGMQERLERIEIAVETTALEVERIAEANRFMAKLLSDRAGSVLPVRGPERVITPH